jgi:DNA-binding GntR family transcriptional regulator
VSTEKASGQLLGGAQPGRVIRTATEVATDLIRRAILTGQLKPGDRLREVDLAGRLGISRTPIREALLILQAEGTVDATPNRGARVHEITLDEVIDFAEIRSALQVHAAYRAATRITEEQLARLDASCDEAQRLLVDGGDDLVAIADGNLDFHDVVVEAAGSPALTRAVKAITRRPLVHFLHTVPAPGSQERALRYCREIAAELRRRDADAARRTMRELTDYVLANLRAHQAG